MMADKRLIYTHRTHLFVNVYERIERNRLHQFDIAHSVALKHLAKSKRNEIN